MIINNNNNNNNNDNNNEFFINQVNHTSNLHLNNKTILRNLKTFQIKSIRMIYYSQFFKNV